MPRSPSAPDAAPRFPQVARQLTEAKASHGSKFEAFIRANQDASLLRPEEREGDGIGLPLWLRVYYRKTHPNEPKAPAGPAGDYPEVLHRIEEWMEVNQSLLPNPDEWLNASRGRTP
jgi:hypothetical protein